MIAAVRPRASTDIPFLGTCGGFQHAILEFARNLAGIDDADHAEYGPSRDRRRSCALECSLVGHEGPIHYTPGTRIAEIAGVERSVERYHCAYGIATALHRAARAGGRDLRRPRR